MTNLTDITIILDNSQLEHDYHPRAKDIEKDSTKTDFSKPLEPNFDDAKTGKEASDSSLLSEINTKTTLESHFNQSATKDLTRPNSAKPSENILKDVALKMEEANVKKCEDSTSTFNLQDNESSLDGQKSETTKDTAISGPNSSILKEKETNENRKEMSVEKPMDDEANVDADTGGVNGENLRRVFDMLDESKSGHISPVSFGHLIRSLGDIFTSKSMFQIQISFLGFFPTDFEIDKMLQTLDPNGNGKLHYGEVSSFLTSQVLTFDYANASINHEKDVFILDRRLSEFKD